jgi:FHA domain
MSDSSSNCPKCALPGWKASIRCPDCGYSAPSVLRLCGEKGLLDFRVGGPVGRPLLQQMVGDDSQFADHHQFTLLHDPDRGWLVAAARTKNPTLLQGHELPPSVPHVLATGDVLTVGASRARMTVELLRGGT